MDLEELKHRKEVIKILHFKNLILFTLVSFAVFLILCEIFSVLGYDLFTKMGYYAIFIPVWALLILTVAVILVLMYDLFKIALVILFIIGLFLIFNGHFVTGLLSLGIFGSIIILIISMGLVTFLTILIPGIIAGIFVTSALQQDLGDWSIIVGIIMFLIVTSIIWDIISKIVIPFSVGFWIGMFTANLASIIASSLFAFQTRPTLDFEDFTFYSSPSDFMQLFEWVQVFLTHLLDYVIFLFEHHMFITIMCVIIGIFMVIFSNMDGED